HRAEQTGITSEEYSGGIYWTDFRGPKRDGHYAGQELKLDWTQAEPKLLWKQPIGGGYSSFVIANGLAYTLEQRREFEAVVAYDLNTGHEVWTNSWKARFTESEGMGGNGPRSTPTWHDGRVYALGALGEFRCLDAKTGTNIWSAHVLNDSKSSQLQFASTASPIVINDKVIVLTGHPAGKHGHGVAAYNRTNGEPVWQSVKEKIAYASPTRFDSQLLIFSAFHVMGLNWNDGRMVWKHPWNVRYDNSIAQPVILEDRRIFLSGSYGQGCEMLKIFPGKENDSPQSLWKNKLLKNKFSSSIFHDGFIYGLDNNILVCLDSETGRKQWKDGRYGYGQILLAQGHIIIMCGDGDLALVKATPEEHIEVARFAALNGKTWNYPALADGKLLIRNHSEMACYDLSTD
ncbi:MAG: PQQ-binding-like beta-propeller repeat protein, partial [Limisphaerales bacterium]